MVYWLWKDANVQEALGSNPSTRRLQNERNRGREWPILSNRETLERQKRHTYMKVVVHKDPSLPLG